MTAQQVAADLRAAAEVLRRDGLIKGKFHGKNGCHCAEGAVALATGIHRLTAPGKWEWNGTAEANERYRHALTALEDHLAAEVLGLPGAYVRAARWNDKRSRTADEVIAALEAAADAADAAEAQQ